MLIQNTSDIGWTNKFVWEVLPDGAWKGNPCFIIGGGTSLKIFDWSLLKGHFTIGINRAFEAFNPEVIFTMDRAKFLRWVLNGGYGEEARRKFINTKAIKVVLCTSQCNLPSDIYVVKAWKSFSRSFNAFPLTTKDGIGHGSNSGYGALNLAACLGANPIYLLGFDMYYDGTKTHWHSGHPKRQPPNALPKYIKFMNVAAEKLKNANIKVINLNPDSNLNCFEKIDPESILAGTRLYMPEKKSILPIYTQLNIDEKKTKTDEQPTNKTRPAGAPFGTAVRVSDFVKMIKPTKDIYITGPQGFGDTFHLRPFVRQMIEKYRHIYVRTTLPEAFWDFPSVRFVRPHPNRLRHQKEHIEYIDRNKEYEWTMPPNEAEHKHWAQITPSWKIHMGVGIPTSKRGEESVSKYIEVEHSIKDFDFSFPLKQAWIDEAKKIYSSLNTGKKKICIIRQPAVNKAWPCYSRNPKLEYFQILIDKYKDDYYFISIGSNVKDYEDYTGKLEGINKRFDKGEFPLTTVFALIKLADMMITFPSFFMLLAIAIRAKCFCIFGGCTKPSINLDKNMGLDNFDFIAPRPFCNCIQMNHDCKRDIPKKEILNKFRALKMKNIQKAKQRENGKEISIGLPPGIGDMHWVLTKLGSFKEKNNIERLKIVINQGPGHEYSSEFLKLVPFIDSIEPTNRHLPFTFSIAGGNGTPLYKNKGGVDYLMEFNSQLENHIKLKDILPEYDVDFDYPINIPEKDIEFAKSIKKEVGGKLYLLYMSSIGANKNWAKGFWRSQDWMALIDKIYNKTGCKPVTIGAKWDSDYIIRLLLLDNNKKIHNLVSKTNVSQLLALIKEANYLVGFLSGIIIMATKFKTPVVSFWPLNNSLFPRGHLNESFQRTWLPPGAEKIGYMPFNYGDPKTTPQNIFNAIRRYL